uniref:Intraflagellar transport 20 n=1 Tax=Rousettus aegyptiacus TaxID=9407 RepID=A0A7J8G955_ROUAE|nr:intraflagellar transport 20 [Rousettus aegyptiacus]
MLSSLLGMPFPDFVTWYVVADTLFLFVFLLETDTTLVPDSGKCTVSCGIHFGADLVFSREARRETAMAKDILGEAGLHFDELNKLRVLDPEVTQQTIELKEECKDFVDKIGQFQKIVGGLIELVDQLAKEAENEKMKAIGARNLLKSIAKQREAQQQQLQALIAEKKMQLERYRVEYEALCKVEAEQNEFIDQFIFQK